MEVRIWLIFSDTSPQFYGSSKSMVSARQTIGRNSWEKSGLMSKRSTVRNTKCITMFSSILFVLFLLVRLLWSCEQGEMVMPFREGSQEEKTTKFGHWLLLIRRYHHNRRRCIYICYIKDKMHVVGGAMGNHTEPLRRTPKRTPSTNTNLIIICGSTFYEGDNATSK